MWLISWLETPPSWKKVKKKNTVSSHEVPRRKIDFAFWLSFTITLSAQPISYHNQHSLTQPYCNFLPFPLIFCPCEICLIVAFTFILLTCNNAIKFRSVLLKARKNKWDTKHFFHKKKNFQFAQSTNKKQIRWQSLMFLFKGWFLLPLNAN